MTGTGSMTVQQPASGPAQNKIERESFISEVPNWIEVEELPWKERCEIQLYKMVSLIPVSVTFCLFIYLFIYYAVVSKSLPDTFVDQRITGMLLFSSTCIRL